MSVDELRASMRGSMRGSRARDAAIRPRAAKCYAPRMDACEGASPRWRINKVEWDALHATTRRSKWVIGIVIGLQVVSGAMCVAASVVIANHPARPRISVTNSPVAWFGIAVLCIACAQIAVYGFAGARWRRLRPVIWGANGCVCPWCRVRVDTTPCPRHGFSADDEGALRAYWEALAVQDGAGVLRAAQELRRMAKRQSAIARLLAPVRMALTRHVTAMQAEGLTPLGRLRESLPWLALELGAMLLVAIGVVVLCERQTAVACLRGCWFAPFVCVIAAMAGVTLRVGGVRCARCSYLCAAEHPTVCTECGADLTQAGSLTRRARMGMRQYAMLLGPIVALVVAGPWLGSLLLQACPGPVRNHVWAAIGPPSDYFQSLAPAQMSSEEVRSAVSMLIAAAAPGGPRVFDFDFLPAAHAAGKVDARMLEDAARATVQARLTVELDAGNATAVVRPAFGTLIFGSQQTPRLAFGGVSVDDGPWSEPAAWSLFLHDTDSIWRSVGTLPVLPEDKLEFRVPLGALTPGTHTVRARCWVVVWGAQWVRMAPAFDTDGALIAPAGAWGVYDMVLTEQVRIR